MDLSISHQTRYRYEPGASQLALRLKMFPPQTDGQSTQDWSVTVNGDPVSPLLKDSFGEGVALWRSQGKTEEVIVEAGGTVTTRDTSGLLGNLFQPAVPPVFLRNTSLTKADPLIVGLAGNVSGDDPLQRLHALSSLVHDAIDYRSGVTGSETTAANAMALGAGVCQDQAHVFIAAARSLNIPARYVAGYLLDPDAEEPAEETHAWAEAHVPGLGWVGFDITNEICPTEHYVRLSTGLDASDATPIRGTIVGSSKETLDVTVHIEQAGSNSQQ